MADSVGDFTNRVLSDNITEAQSNDVWTIDSN